MKIALIGPVYPYRGGIAHYTTMLNQALHQHGHDILLISFQRQYPQWLFPGRTDKDPSNAPLRVDHSHFWLDSLNPFTWLSTFWRLRAYQPDLLVLPWWTTFFAPLWLTLLLLNRSLKGSRVCFICHNVLPHEANRWDLRITQAVLRWGDHFIVQSAEERDRLLTLVKSHDIAIVPMPIFGMFAEHKVTHAAARQRLNLAPNKHILLFFGIVRSYKGLPELLEALSLVRRRLPEIYLLIAGEFWKDKATYLQQITRLGLDDIVFIDDRYIPNEEVGLYFSCADLVVAPYRHLTGSAVAKMAEGFGVPIITSQMIMSPRGEDDRNRKVPGINLSTASQKNFAPHRQAQALDKVFPDNDTASSILEERRCDPRLLAEAILDHFATGVNGAQPTPKAQALTTSWHSVVQALEVFGPSDRSSAL